MFNKAIFHHLLSCTTSKISCAYFNIHKSSVVLHATLCTSSLALFLLFSFNFWGLSSYLTSPSKRSVDLTSKHSKLYMKGGLVLEVVQFHGVFQGLPFIIHSHAFRIQPFAVIDKGLHILNC